MSNKCTQITGVESNQTQVKIQVQVAGALEPYWISIIPKEDRVLLSLTRIGEKALSPVIVCPNLLDIRFVKNDDLTNQKEGVTRMLAQESPRNQ